MVLGMADGYRVTCHKLGGSTFKDAEAFMAAARYLDGQFRAGFRPIAVVSAPRGVSDLLVEALSSSKEALEDLSRSLRDRYTAIVASMTGGSPPKDVVDAVDDSLNAMRDAYKNGERDRFLAQGENHSGILLSHALSAFGLSGEYMDGVEAGIVVSSRGTAREKESIDCLKHQVREALERDRAVPIVGGYVGRCVKTGAYRLMGRNSTDVTGALVACAAGAEAYEIIKDVPGIYRVEPEFGKTGIVEKMSYDEAGQIAWRGAKVVHPLAIAISGRNSVPIRVKSFDSESCTLVSDETGTDASQPVAVISAGVFCLIDISDDVMNTPEGRGYLAEVAEVLSALGVDILDCAMPANTMSFTIPVDDLRHRPTLKDDLESALMERGYDPSIFIKEVGGISVTGEGMKDRPGTLSWLAGILGTEGISVAMGSQSDEAVASPTINFYVDAESLQKAVTALCGKLFR